MKKPRPIHYFIVAVIVAVGAAALLAQSPNKLSRPAAKKLIEAAKEFSTPAREEIWLGRDFRRTDYLQSINWDLADDMVDLGYLTKPGTDYVLGPKGVAAEPDWGKIENLPKSRLIPIATRRVIQITGITYDAKGAAQVEFEWQYIWTKFGEVVSAGKGRATSKIYQRYSPYETRSGVAFLHLYDDGWRTGMIQLKN